MCQQVTAEILRPCVNLGYCPGSWEWVRWSYQGGPSLFILSLCISWNAFLCLQQDIKRLTRRPSSLIYEVADWTRRHNRDSPSHLQGETPESSNSVCAKARSRRGPQWCWKTHPAEPIPEMMPKPACVPALGRDRDSFVTWPLSSTQPWILRCPPFARRTEVQPCPGHC